MTASATNSSIPQINSEVELYNDALRDVIYMPLRKREQNII